MKMKVDKSFASVKNIKISLEEIQAYFFLVFAFETCYDCANKWRFKWAFWHF